MQNNSHKNLNKLMIIVASFLMGMTFNYLSGEYNTYQWFIDVDMVTTTPTQQTDSNEHN